MCVDGAQNVLTGLGVLRSNVTEIALSCNINTIYSGMQIKYKVTFMTDKVFLLQFRGVCA